MPYTSGMRCCLNCRWEGPDDQTDYGKCPNCDPDIKLRGKQDCQFGTLLDKLKETAQFHTWDHHGPTPGFPNQRCDEAKTNDYMKSRYGQDAFCRYLKNKKIFRALGHKVEIYVVVK